MVTSKIEGKGANADRCLREGTGSRNRWRWRGVQRASTRTNISRRVEFSYNVLRRNGRKMAEGLVGVNRRNRIRFIYESLSEHFDVPIPKWVILPRSKAPIIRSDMRILASLGMRSIDINNFRPQGMFQYLPHPQIRLFGKPTDRTVFHEFMHYLVYCTKNHLINTKKNAANKA